jgi:hypothetical protein
MLTLFKLRHFRKQKIDRAFGFYRNFTMPTQNACSSKTSRITHTQIPHGTRCSSYLPKDIEIKACRCYLRMWILHKGPTCRLIKGRSFVLVKLWNILGGAAFEKNWGLGFWLLGFWNLYGFPAPNACNSKLRCITHIQISHGARCNSYLSKGVKIKVCCCCLRSWTPHKVLKGDWFEGHQRWPFVQNHRTYFSSFNS